MVGESVGRYRLDGVIGVGSFATVHRAKDDRLEDTIVLKILAENHSLNPEIRERFIAEGRSLRRVSSPHVVTVHDIGESERQQPYLVLEYADRGTLGDRVTELRRGGWTAHREDLLVVARSLAAALHAVHGAHLVHRDLSPANVLLTAEPAEALDQHAPSGAMVLRDDERLILADLGMCKDLAFNSGLTVAGGTSGFRPPELLGGPAVIDTRADLYSLSALLTWLGQGADLPGDLTPTLQRSLAIDPADRHPDVRAWLADVETALGQPPTATPSPHADESGAGVAPSVAAGSRPRLPWFVGLVAALAIGLVAGLLLGGIDAPQATQSARIAIEGPDAITVGERATFTIRQVGVDSWVWVLPTGEHIADRHSVALTADSTGSAELVLRARDGAGDDLEFVHHLQVSG